MKQMWSKEEIETMNKDISTLVDSAGNPRFIEGDGVPATITGFTATYCKWSLSGTHLMLVLAGSVANGVEISNLTILTNFYLPTWIINKINPVVNTIVEYKTITFYASNFTSQSINTFLNKSNDRMSIATNGTLTLTAERNFRIQFDLLIDSE